MKGLFDKVHKSWYPIISRLADDKLRELFYSDNIYPSIENIFNVFSMPLQDIKLVILGQDPYPTPGMATGYAFEPGLNYTPTSLRIMQKELNGNIDFKQLREQGVFLLNSALTVEKGKAGSHLKLWKTFTENLIKTISIKNPTIWLLMGKKAQEFIPSIYSPLFLSNDQNYDNTPITTVFNYVFNTPHPAAEVYTGGKAGFLGSDIFNNISKLYQLKYGKELKWQTKIETKDIEQKESMQNNSEP